MRNMRWAALTAGVLLLAGTAAGYGYDNRSGLAGGDGGNGNIKYRHAGRQSVPRLKAPLNPRGGAQDLRPRGGRTVSLGAQGSRASRRPQQRHAAVRTRPYKTKRAQAPKRGTVVKELPKGFDEVTVKSKKYAYDSGTGAFYAPVSEGFKVVRAPEGALVRWLPTGYQTKYVDGEKRYAASGTLFKAVMDDGRVTYQVVKR